MGFLRRFGWILAGLTAPLSIASVSSQPSIHAPAAALPDISMFERPAVLQPNIGFWTRVFSEYSEFQSAIHLIDQPHKIYAVLDFRDVAAREGPAAARRQQLKAEKNVKRVLDQYLKRAHLLRSTPEQLTPAERKAYDLLADGSDPDRYQKAVGRFRAQRGLKEATERALRISGQYLPKMESIFASEGLPTLLTRLPLVESSFNVEAYSKVGAAGLWQFIPSSARIYMRLDEAVDDRRDPWTSTQAAARHLKEDYATLGSWPLAITAYNHGRAGLAHGLRQVNGTRLEDLLERWDGPRFGFASRNFYSEFLAAMDVERNYREHFGELDRGTPIEFDTVQTQHYVPYEVLRRSAAVDQTLFRQLNPGFRPEVLDGRLHVPPQSAIRIPLGQAESFKTAYATLGDSERFDQQRFYYVRYRVQSGDTLGVIARRHRVSLSSLKQANSIRDARFLRIGQVLRIPPRGGAQAVEVATAVEPPPGVPATGGAGYLHHHITKGQTLFAIAQQYRTSIAKLRQLNGFDESHSLLQAGATIKVPSH